MRRTNATAWIVCLCATVLRRSQAKTLSQLVWAAVGMTRTSLAELGRCLSRWTGVAAKHSIKRVDRFMGNDRIEPAEAMRGAIRWLARPRKKLLVSMDWVEIRSYHCLVLAARLGGRAVPLLWSVYRDTGDLLRSQNNRKYGLLRLLRTMVPRTTQVVILADRGLGRTEMARECQTLQFDYILRIRPDVYIRHPAFTGKLLDLPVRRGSQRVLRHVAYRKRRPLTQHVAVLWRADQDEPWFLATNLPRLQPKKLSRIYGRRMSIEAYFRDAKSKRNGFALRLTLIRSPKRLERLLLVLALAYWLLVAIGLHASRHFRSGLWRSNNRRGECSLFTVGRYMIDHIHVPLRAALNNLRTQLLQGNWG